MGTDQTELTGPDLTQGIPLSELADGEMITGHANGEQVLLARRGDELFAIGATCTHYSGPLGEGLMVGDTVRCPWHHACFSLRTGEALRAPALHPVACWRVERRNDTVFVTDKITPERRRLEKVDAPTITSIVIVGAGAAGDAAAEMLRREGYDGQIVMIGKDNAPPYDRPNLSKDYLAGTAPEEWLPLRSPSFYQEQNIKLVLEDQVTAIDTGSGNVILASGRTYPYNRLLLATGAVPVHLPLPGGDLPHVHYLRTLADCRAILAHENARRAVVIGASFIGMEVAASLRTRNLDVHVVAPDSQPLQRVFGPDLGAMLRSLHEDQGVVFHLEQTVTEIHPETVTLSNGEELPADLVVIGVGVRPDTTLAEQTGLKTENGVLVNEYLETSQPGIYAAGDIARWPDPRSDRNIRIEHWVVAQRQGQVAARNMLGHRQAFDYAPFFWTQHYDVPVNYVGHAPEWDQIDVAGSIPGRDCLVAYRSGGKTLAVASIYRDLDSLKAETAMERGDEQTLAELIPPAR